MTDHESIYLEVSAIAPPLKVLSLRGTTSIDKQKDMCEIAIQMEGYTHRNNC